MSTESAVPLESLAELPEFYHPVVTPDGDRIAFYYDGTGRNELYVMDREGGEYERMSDGDVPRDARWHLRWGADGDRIIFHRDDDGDEQNDLLSIAVTGDDRGETSVVVAPDGQGHLMDVTPEYVLYASDEGHQLNLYRHDLATGENEQLTHYDQPILSATCSQSGDRIAYIANESDRLVNRDAYVMAADGTNQRRLDVGEDGSETYVGPWFPDGDRLLVSDNAGEYRRVGVYSLATDDVRWLGSHDHDENAVAVSPDGERVLATRDRRAASMPVVYDVEAGTGHELDLPEGVTGLFQFTMSAAGGVFADDSTVVLAHSTADERRQLYEYDLRTDEKRILLPATYDDVGRETFVDAEYVRYDSVDDLDIGALLFDPRQGPAVADDATDVPAVVMVHGGPQFQSTRRFNLHVQFLCSRGYAVLQPNYRGSTGRGRSFKHAIHDDWGGKEQVDVANGGRWLMDRDWIDADRVAVFGGSYGGYSVYCQLTQFPDLWTTGIAWVGFTDLHRLHEDDMAHFQHGLEMMMGDPEENHDLWRERSPIEHVDRMERPIFMIHGVNDPRCPVIQARMFRDALDDRGWVEGEDFEYEELGAEGHGSRDIDQKIRMYRLLDDYLGRRL